MKVIGVEFRLQINNHVAGQRQYEIFLHPLDIDVPEDLGECSANMTVHTSEGDRGTGQTLLRGAKCGLNHLPPQAIQKLTEDFERKYAGK